MYDNAVPVPFTETVFLYVFAIFQTIRLRKIILFNNKNL